MLKSFTVNEKFRITRLYSYFQADFDGGYSYPGELHNFWECVYVQEGELCAIAEGKVYNLSAGSLIFHRPMEFHGLFVEENKQAKVLIFSFDAEGALEEYISGNVFNLDERQIGILAALVEYVDHAYMETQKGQQGDLHWFVKYHSLFEREPRSVPMVASYIGQIILSLTDGVEIVANSQAPDARIYRRAVDHMNLYLHTAISVPELAKYVNVSESSLLRIFKKYAQTSVHRYFLLMKIKTATELLEGGMEVGLVAEKLGFNSQPYFSVCYKRETGRNPSEIRKK